MEGVKASLKGLRLRDLTLVVLCGLIVYLFRAQDSYQLIPVWRKMAKSEHFANKAYPTSNEKLPSAIITDLESDGINEIVLITNDLRLSIMAMPDGNKSSGDERKLDTRVLPNVIIKAAVDLPANKSLPGGREWPVVMETGYLMPYKSLVQVRKQVIVVVLDSWTVLCYDHDLQMLWKRQLMDTSSVRQTHIVKSMSALMSPIAVQKDDQGLVVVAGSLVHASHGGRHSARHSHSAQTLDNDYFSHFSTFALSGQDGTTRWQHLPGDFDKPKTEDEEEPFHWKLRLKRGHLHMGESPWAHFQSDLLQQLPHYWNDLKDTDITLANVKKNLIGQPSPQPAVTEAVIGALGGEHIMGYAYGGMRPHSHHEHVENANVIVIHNQNGVEVLTLQTGRPVTRLSLPEGRSVYLDIDDDTIIEKVSFYLEDEFTKARICNVEVQHFMWRLKKKKFQTSVCDSWRFFWGWTVPEREDTIKHLPPRVIKSVAEKRSIFQHLTGDHLVSAGKAWDIIVTTSSGRVSSLSSSGAIQWQVDTPVSWVNEAESATSPAADHSHRFYSSFQPSITEFSLQVYGKKDTLAMVGWRNLAIVDLKKGRLLGEHSIPCQPTDTPVIGDFDNDGNNDIILVCPVGYIGFSIHKQPNHVYTAVYGAGVFLGILLITWCLMSDSDHSSDAVD